MKKVCNMLYLKEIEYFLAIAKEGNISKAAEKLHIAQPSLSAYVSRLEGALDTKLFIRSGRKMQLTPAGELYFDMAKNVHLLVQEANAKIADLHLQIEGQLRLGITGERAFRFVEKILPDFRNKCPNVTISIYEFPVFTLEAMLIHGDLDLALHAQTDEISGVEAQIIKHSELVLAIPNTHRLARFGTKNPREKITRFPIEEFQDDAFCLLVENTVSYQNVAKYFAEHGFAPKVLLRVPATHSCLLTVSRGQAVGFVPRTYDFMGKNIVYVGVEGEIPYNLCVTYRNNGGFLSRSQKALIRIIKAHKDEL